MPDAAERLRTAAARMRARVERVARDSGLSSAADLNQAMWYGQTDDYRDPDEVFDSTHAHISTFGHPAVALAVADLLADTADDLDRAIESDQRLQQMAADLGRKPLGDGPPFAHHLAALKVADAFLGATP